VIDRGAHLEHRSGDLTPLAHAVDVAIDGTHQRGEDPSDVPTHIIELLLDAGGDPAPGLEIAKGYESAKVIDVITTAKRRR